MAMFQSKDSAGRPSVSKVLYNQGAPINFSESPENFKFVGDRSTRGKGRYLDKPSTQGPTTAVQMEGVWELVETPSKKRKVTKSPQAVQAVNDSPSHNRDEQAEIVVFLKGKKSDITLIKPETVRKDLTDQFS